MTATATATAFGLAMTATATAFGLAMTAPATATAFGFVMTATACGEPTEPAQRRCVRTSTPSR